MWIGIEGLGGQDENGAERKGRQTSLAHRKFGDGEALGASFGTASEEGRGETKSGGGGACGKTLGAQGRTAGCRG